jgi:hypothetical protein|uniref:thiol oxidase n=1 Tax=viral metagenome TaxID=1070528 RepID=A0A6C0DHE5_9ZZZZ
MANLDPKIWGPKYWFFLHTISLSYPNFPNTITKKRYYELIQNMPQFIPVEEIATNFSKLLNEFPVQPYLDNRESFIKWVWFIHNKINEKLEKPIITLNEFYVKYYDEYKPNNVKLLEYYKIKQKIIYIIIIIFICSIIYYLYDK